MVCHGISGIAIPQMMEIYESEKDEHIHGRQSREQDETQSP